MKVFAVNDDSQTAITIGHVTWFNNQGLALVACSEAEVLRICRPGDNKKVGAFDAYISMLKERGAVYFLSEADVPPTYKKQLGFWESNGTR